MDRFIENFYCQITDKINNLKSNMDRFIGRQTRTQERIF